MLNFRSYSIFLLFILFSFHLAGQNFQTTLHRDFLNDGEKKSLIFSNENGETLHFLNLQPEGYDKDMVVEFQSPGGFGIHLTIISKKHRNFRGRMTYRPEAITYCNILHNSIINYFEESDPMQYYTESGERETKLIDIKGIRTLEDIMTESKHYNISKNKIRKDSILRLRLTYNPEAEILIFMKVNGESKYRQLHVPAGEKMPRDMILDDLISDINIREIDLPEGGEWTMDISTINTETNARLNLFWQPFIKLNSNSILYPEPEELVLDDYRLSATFSPNVNTNDGSHYFRQVSPEAPTEIYTYEPISFDLIDNFSSFEFTPAGISDYFSVMTDYKGYSRHGTRPVSLFQWYFMGQISDSQKIKIIYPEFPPEVLNYFGGEWNPTENKVKYSAVIKSLYQVEKEDWLHPVDLRYLLRDDSYYRFSKAYRN